MSDTPETDAAIKTQAQWGRPFISYTMDGITWDGPVADLCRRLERERDEAMDMLSKLSFFLGCGIGDENITAKQFYDRIVEGFVSNNNRLEAEKILI